MKLIGITGKSGSGKTTLSRMLEKDNSIGVIHLDEVFNMKEIKQKIPNYIINKNQVSNEQGEEFIVLTGKSRTIRDKMLENKLLKKIYYVALYLPRKIALKKALNDVIQSGKDTIIIEGASLGDFSVYNELDYLIQISAPFVEREERVKKRKDAFFDKTSIVKRDIRFRDAQRYRKKSVKQIDERIKNIGTIEDLQKIADRIYTEQVIGIKQKNDETMQEKYGGYKIITPEMEMKSKSERSEKGDTTK